MTTGEIVAKLAVSKEPVDRLDCYCIFCTRSLTLGRVDDHAKDCPWRMAKEFTQVSASPQEG
jgi:hypothetical protein